jgi:hypothetical protein
MRNKETYVQSKGLRVFLTDGTPTDTMRSLLGDGSSHVNGISCGLRGSCPRWQSPAAQPIGGLLILRDYARAHALVAVVNSRCSRWSSLRRSARRVRIVLLAADGLSNTAFAERVGCRVRR